MNPTDRSADDSDDVEVIEVFGPDGTSVPSEQNNVLKWRPRWMDRLTDRDESGTRGYAL